MTLSRRSFFIGAASLLAAPAVVRAASLMPVALPPEDLIWLPMTEVYGIQPKLARTEYRAFGAARTHLEWDIGHVPIAKRDALRQLAGVRPVDWAPFHTGESSVLGQTTDEAIQKLVDARQAFRPDRSLGQGVLVVPARDWTDADSEYWPCQTDNDGNIIRGTSHLTLQELRAG